MSLRPLILVVDDEPQIQRFLRPALTAAGYDVEQAATGAEGAAACGGACAVARHSRSWIAGRRRQECDYASIWKRRSSSFRRARGRRRRSRRSIWALTIMSRSPSGLANCSRASASVRAPARPIRPGPSASTSARWRSICAVGRLADALVKLTPKEFDLLTLLAMHPGRVMTHRQILEKIWGPAHVEDTPYLRVFIGQLRAKIEADPASPRMILTEPGVGYRLSGDD